MFTQSAFCQSAINSLGETTVGYTLTAARYAVLSWDWYTQTFFSAKAEDRYQEVGESIGLVLVALYQGWMTTCDVIDQHVQACEVKRLPQVEKIDEAAEEDFVIDDYMDDEDLPSTSHEDYLDRKIELEGMTLKALVPLAANLNIAIRKVRTEVLVEAILKAEGYQA